MPHFLFSEYANRVIVTCDEISIPTIERFAAENQFFADKAGVTGGSSLHISFNGEELIDVGIGDLQRAHATALDRQLEAEIALA